MKIRREGRVIDRESYNGVGVKKILNVSNTPEGNRVGLPPRGKHVAARASTDRQRERER